VTIPLRGVQPKLSKEEQQKVLEERLAKMRYSTRFVTGHPGSRGVSN
jgi:hypothetical protein